MNVYINKLLILLNLIVNIKVLLNIIIQIIVIKRSK